MKFKILFVVIILAMLTAFSFGSSGVLPFNHNYRTLSKSVTKDMDKVGATSQAVNDYYTNAFGTKQWKGNLEDTGERKTIRKGEKFFNSGLAWSDEKHTELKSTTCVSIAKADVQLCLVLCKPTKVKQWIKRDCLNGAGRKKVPNTPSTSQTCEEVTKPEQVGTIGIDIRVSANATVYNDVSASAIGGDTILNFFQPASSMMTPSLNWSGQTVVTYNPLLGIGWQQPNNTKIVNTNINNNANTNVNANNQVQNMVNGNGASGAASGSAAGAGSSTAGGHGH